MSRAWAAWQKFWFAPPSLAPLVLVRIGLGVLATLWALTVLPDATDFFGSAGVLEEPAPRSGAWTVLDLWTSDAAAVTVVAVLAVSGVALALGSRIAAVLVFVCLVSLSARNPAVGNAGDGLLRTLSFYVMLAPISAGVALRLVQVQLSFIYVFTVWAKLRGDTWVDGTAVSYAFRLEDLARFPLPDVGAVIVLAHVLTYGVLALELALGVLVWNRRARPWVLLCGVLLHLGIEYRLRVGFFSWAMLVTYLAFVPGDVAERALRRMRGWLPSRRWLASASTP
jgi:hypothetical protein